MQGFWLKGLFRRKATKSKSVISDFSLQNSSSINHSKISIYPMAYMVENNYFFHLSTIFIIIIVPLLTLCGKSVKQSHCPWAAEQFESILLTLQGKPNTHAWGAKSPTQHFPFLLVSRDRPTTLDYKYDDSAPADGGVVCPTPRSN